MDVLLSTYNYSIFFFAPSHFFSLLGNSKSTCLFFNVLVSFDLFQMVKVSFCSYIFFFVPYIELMANIEKVSRKIYDFFVNCFHIGTLLKQNTKKEQIQVQYRNGAKDVLFLGSKMLFIWKICSSFRNKSWFVLEKVTFLTL
jgi:hypothetical protein